MMHLIAPEKTNCYAKYFNSGGMYINVDNRGANNYQSKVLTILSTDKLHFADQDVLNWQVNYVNDKSNYRYHLVYFLSTGSNSFAVTVLVVFMHFIGPAKLWKN